MNVMKLMVVALAGWIDQQQEDVIEYLRELPRAAWRIASLLPPGCKANPTIRVFGHFGERQRKSQLVRQLSALTPHELAEVLLRVLL